MPIVIKKKPKNPFPEIPDPFGYGQRAVNFLRGLKHPKSTLPDHAFQLDPWQEYIVRRVYGPCHTQDVFTDSGILLHAKGDRIVSDVVILIPRGNRKTSLCGALALLHTMGPEAVPLGEVVCAAATREQAKKVFAEAQGIIEAGASSLWVKGQASRRFNSETMIKLQDYRNRIAFPNGSTLSAMSADAESQHGGTPVAAFVDELHAHKNRKLWDVIDSGLPKTRNSLRVTITTAGRGQDNIGYEIIERARKVARGEIDAPYILPILFEVSPDDDWRDEKVWLKANPGLPYGYPSYGDLRKKSRDAEDSPGNLDTFKMLHLNMWLDKSTSPFVDMAVYDKGAGSIDLDALEGAPCWLGVDLGATDDLSAIVAAFRDPVHEEGYIVLPFFFMPADNVEKRQGQSGFPYALHVGEGRIVATPGNVTDYRIVEAVIRDLCERFQAKEIAFDPHYAGMLMNNLLEDGYPAVAFRQGWATMGPAIKELERAILAGRFQHGGHPVLRWNFSNIAIQDDGKGNKSFNKSKSTEKIDGAVAAAMAVARAAAGEDVGHSFYENDDWADYAVINC